MVILSDDHLTSTSPLSPLSSTTNYDRCFVLCLQYYDIILYITMIVSYDATYYDTIYSTIHEKIKLTI